MSNQDMRSLDEAAIREQTTKIWNEVLGVRDGQEGATFFELDGQSITAVQLVARLEEELGIWVDVGDLFEDPDLDTFVREILAKRESAEPGR